MYRYNMLIITINLKFKKVLTIAAHVKILRLQSKISFL